MNTFGTFYVDFQNRYLAQLHRNTHAPPGHRPLQGFNAAAARRFAVLDPAPDLGSAAAAPITHPGCPSRIEKNTPSNNVAVLTLSGR